MYSDDSDYYYYIEVEDSEAGSGLVEDEEVRLEDVSEADGKADTQVSGRGEKHGVFDQQRLGDQDGPTAQPEAEGVERLVEADVEVTQTGRGDQEETWSDPEARAVNISRTYVENLNDTEVDNMIMEAAEDFFAEDTAGADFLGNSSNISVNKANEEMFEAFNNRTIEAAEATANDTLTGWQEVTTEVKNWLNNSISEVTEANSEATEENQFLGIPWEYWKYIGGGIILAIGMGLIGIWYCCWKAEVNRRRSDLEQARNLVNNDNSARTSDDSRTEAEQHLQQTGAEYAHEATQVLPDSDGFVEVALYNDTGARPKTTASRRSRSDKSSLPPLPPLPSSTLDLNLCTGGYNAPWAEADRHTLHRVQGILNQRVPVNRTLPLTDTAELDSIGNLPVYNTQDAAFKLDGLHYQQKVKLAALMSITQDWQQCKKVLQNLANNPLVYSPRQVNDINGTLDQIYTDGAIEMRTVLDRVDRLRAETMGLYVQMAGDAAFRTTSAYSRVVLPPSNIRLREHRLSTISSRVYEYLEPQTDPGQETLAEVKENFPDASDFRVINKERAGSRLSIDIEQVDERTPKSEDDAAEQGRKLAEALEAELTFYDEYVEEQLQTGRPLRGRGDGQSKQTEL